MNKRKIMSSVVKSSGGVTYTPSLVTLESGEDIKSAKLTDTDILSGQSIQQILNSGAVKDNSWYRTEVTETDEDYTKWTSGDSYSIVNSKTSQPYNTINTGCRNILGGYRNNVFGDDSLMIGHDNISAGNQNLVLGCNCYNNSSSSIVLNDAGWDIKVKYRSTSGSNIYYDVVELDSDGLLASIFLRRGSVNIKLRNLNIIGQLSKTGLTINGSYKHNDPNTIDILTETYGTDPDTIITISFSICQSEQSCSISMGGLSLNDPLGYYSLAMSGGITSGMGSIATGYGALSSDYSLALGTGARAESGSIALTYSNADGRSISIPSMYGYSYSGTFSDDDSKLILQNFTDTDFDTLQTGSTNTTYCYISTNVCKGYGVIHKDERESYYINYRDLCFVKQPSVGSTYNVSIVPSNNADNGSINIGANGVQNNSLAVGQINVVSGDIYNCALFGNNNIVQNDSEVAIGSWNKSSENTKFTIGVGTSSTDRKNAFEVSTAGDVYVKGVGSYDGTNKDSTNSIQTVINNKQDVLVSGTSIKTINGESILGSGDITISGGGTSTGKDVYIFNTNSYIGHPLPSYQFTYEDMTNISTAMNSGNYSQMYIKFTDNNLCAVTYYDDNAISATSGTITMCIQIEYKSVVIKIANVAGTPHTTYSIQTTDSLSGDPGIITIQPNIFYDFGQADSLTIGLADIANISQYNEYMFQFESGATPTTLSVGGGSQEIKWIGDHTIEANKTYQVSIVNNLAVMGGA